MCVCVIGQIGFITLYPCQSIGSVTHVVVYMVGTESIWGSADSDERTVVVMFNSEFIVAALVVAEMLGNNNFW